MKGVQLPPMSLREPDILARRAVTDREYRPETQSERDKKALKKAVEDALSQVGRLKQCAQHLEEHLLSIQAKVISA